MENVNLCPGRTCKAVRKHKNRLPELNEFNVDEEHHKRNDRCQLSSGLQSCKKAVITCRHNKNYLAKRDSIKAIYQLTI